MQILMPIITGLSSFVMFGAGYAFFPRRMNYFAMYEIAGLPLWAVCLGLAPMLLVVTGVLVRQRVSSGRKRRHDLTAHAS